MGKRIFRKELFLRECVRNGTPTEDITEALDVWVMKCDGMEIDELVRTLFKGVKRTSKLQLPDEWFQIVKE